MASFIVHPLDPALTRSIRETLRDAQGRPANVSVAGPGGYGPCRSCLRQFQPGERRILFAHTPLVSDTPYHEQGPVFIHEDPCRPYTETNRFPEEVIRGRLPIPLSLRGYTAEGRMEGARLHKEEDIEALLEHLFADVAIETVQVRNAEAGCFIANIRRA